MQLSTSSKPIVHVAFCMSAAGSIRQALSLTGSKEAVFGFPDDVSYGPIRTSGTEARKEGVRGLLVYDLDEVIDLAELFWRNVTSLDVDPIAWVCRNDAGEYAGFLEFVRRMADRPFQVIDATGVQIGDSQRTFVPKTLGVISSGQIVAARLLDCQTRLDPAERDRCVTHWQRLMDEDAPFRVIQNGVLVSKPLSHFDETIVAGVTTDWQLAARVIGNLLTLAGTGRFDQCPSDMVLWSRICALSDAGILEISGDQAMMRGNQVRLKT